MSGASPPCGTAGSATMVCPVSTARTPSIRPLAGTPSYSARRASLRARAVLLIASHIVSVSPAASCASIVSQCRAVGVACTSPPRAHGHNAGSQTGMEDHAHPDDAEGSARWRAGEAMDRHRAERSARPAEERGGPPHHVLARGGDARRSLRPRRHRGERYRTARGDHSRRSRRRHRVRHARSATRPRGQPTARQPAPGARGNRGASTGRVRATRGAQTQCQTPSTSAREARRPGAGANSGDRETAQEARRGLASEPRNARGREPLH